MRAKIIIFSNWAGLAMLFLAFLFLAFLPFQNARAVVDVTPPHAVIFSFVHVDGVNDKLYFDIYDLGGSGMASAQLFQDDVYVMDISSPYGSVVYDTSALADGAYQLEVVATDIVGNTVTSSPYTMVLDSDPPPPPPDTTAPHVAILSVVGNKIYTDIYDLGSSGIAQVDLYVDNVLSQTIIPPTTYDLITVDTGVLADGDHEVLISAADSAGNQATSSAYQITGVDNTAPATADDVPDSSQFGSTVITFICTDSGSGCQKTYYTTDGTDPTIDSNQVNASSSWKFSISSIGSYAIRYRSIDNRGNLEAVKTAANTLVIRQASSGGGGTWWPSINAYITTTTPNTATSTVDNSTTTIPAEIATTTLVLGVKIYENGVLLRGPDFKIYALKNGGKYHIGSLLELWNYRSWKSHNVSAEEISAYEDFTGRIYDPGVLLRAKDFKIYAVKEGMKKHHIGDLIGLQEYKGWRQYNVSDATISLYPSI